LFTSFDAFETFLYSDEATAIFRQENKPVGVGRSIAKSYYRMLAGEERSDGRARFR